MDITKLEQLIFSGKPNKDWVTQMDVAKILRLEIINSSNYVFKGTLWWSLYSRIFVLVLQLSGARNKENKK